MSYAKRWVFTINNPIPEDEARIAENDEAYEYLVYGKETGSSGTPHLQGFVIFKSRKRLAQLRGLISERGHYEVARGTADQAASYCKKDGDFVEFGNAPDSDVGGQGKRSDFERLKEWIIEQDDPPTHYEIASAFPSLWGRYKNACLNFVEIFSPKAQLVSGELRGWQAELDEMIKEEADDRIIQFVVDAEGNKGKSWLTRYWFSERTDMQRLSVGKRDDLAYAIDTSKRVFVFDIPRGQLEYLQYSVLESLKDQMVFSPKYESSAKVIRHKVHVVVFTNEEPDVTKMTIDRFNIKYI